MRQQFDWPAGLIDRVSSLMRCKKKKRKKLSERILLTPRMGAKMVSNTWAQIERDRWKKRKGWKGVKRNVVEARRQEKQGGGGGVSCTYPQTCWKKAREESI